MTLEEEKQKAEIELIKEKKTFYDNAGCLMFILCVIAICYFLNHC